MSLLRKPILLRSSRLAKRRRQALYFKAAAIVFVILAAFQFLSGGGDPQQIVQARQKLIWAAVAVIVATLSRAIPTVVNNIVGG